MWMFMAALFKLPKSGDFPGGPVAKTVLPMQEAWVRSLVRELDPILDDIATSSNASMKIPQACN